MPTIELVTRSGKRLSLTGNPGIALKDCIVGAGVHEMEAQCGGHCSCGTCHVFIAAEHFGRLAPKSPAEKDLIDSLLHSAAHSRLACQITLEADHDGLQVTIAPGE